MRNKVFKSLLLSVIAVTVLALPSFSGNDVNVKARHKYHYRYTRKARWRRRRKEYLHRYKHKKLVWRATKHYRKYRKHKKNIYRNIGYKHYTKRIKKDKRVKKYKEPRKSKHRQKMSQKEFFKEMNAILDNQENFLKNNDKRVNQNGNIDNSSDTSNSDSNDIFSNKALYNTDNVYTGDIQYPDGSSEDIDTPQKIHDNELSADLQTLNELNADRESLGEPKFTLDPGLASIAMKRAKQLVNNYSHYDSNNHAYYGDEDARSLGLSSSVVQAENIAKDSSTDEDNNGTKESEVGPMAADNANLGMFNEEQGSTPSQDGGHRVNIESPQDTKVGVGTVYNPSNSTYYIAEEFGGTLFN